MVVQIPKISALLVAGRQGKGTRWLSGSDAEDIRHVSGGQDKDGDMVVERFRSRRFPPVGGGQDEEGDMVVEWFKSRRSPSCWRRSEQGREYGG